MCDLPCGHRLSRRQFRTCAWPDLHSVHKLLESNWFIGVWRLHLSLFPNYAVARRHASVSPLKDEEGRTQFEAYSAVFEGEPALIKLLYDNHESAAVHAAWANVGLAPPLLLSERVHALAAKHVRFGKRIGEVDHTTNVHTVRSCLALPGVLGHDSDTEALWRCTLWASHACR